MKYLEEISFGDCFLSDGKYFVLTTDFKKNNSKLAVSLFDGSSRWFKSDEIIDQIDIFTLDKDSNILAIKERKADVTNSTQDVL